MSTYDPTTNTLHPRTDATVTIRVIKNFEYRTTRNLLLKHLNLEEMTVGQLIERCKEEVKKTPAFKAYRTTEFDTLKLYTQAHGAKTTNLIINLDHPDWILEDHDQILADVRIGEQRIENETELSLFDREAYEKFLLNPETRWD